MKTKTMKQVISKLREYDEKTMRCLGGMLAEAEQRKKENIEPSGSSVFFDSLVMQPTILATSPNAKSLDGDGYLHIAASAGSEALCRAALERGANIDEPDAFGNTPIMRAFLGRGSNWDIIRFFLKSGADLSIKNEFGKTFLDLVELYKNN